MAFFSLTSVGFFAAAASLETAAEIDCDSEGGGAATVLGAPKGVAAVVTAEVGSSELKTSLGCFRPGEIRDGNAEDEGGLASTVVDGRSTGVVGCLATGVDEVEFVNGAAVAIGTVSGISSVLVAGTATGNSVEGLDETGFRGAAVALGRIGCCGNTWPLSRG